MSEELRTAATRLAIQAARTDLLAFVLLMNPNFSLGPHHRWMCDELMALEAGTIRRLMLFVSPRSSKSLIASCYFTAWALGRHPQWFAIEVSHARDLAVKFGRQVRDLLSSRQFQAIFPGVSVKKNNSAADMWATNKDGEFAAFGTEAGIAGFGGNLVIIDDPLSEQDAFSKTRRHAINNWYTGGLRTRLQPGARVLVIQTRWAEDDLSGYLLGLAQKEKRADQWKVVKIPALNTEESLPHLRAACQKLQTQGYLPTEYPELRLQESFWPVGTIEGKLSNDVDAAFCWPTEEFLSTQATTPDYQWNALYMQSPSNPEGGIIKPEYWQPWASTHPPELLYKIISMDTAFSTKDTADFSAITTWGVFHRLNEDTETFEPQIILLGARKGRWSFPELRAKALESFTHHKPHGILVEKRASGQSLIQDLRMMGLPIFDFQPDRDKEARAHACSTFFKQGRVWCNWETKHAREVIEECRAFPTPGVHDDYVDTVTQAILWLRNGGFVVPDESPWYDIDEDAIMTERPRKYY